MRKKKAKQLKRAAEMVTVGQSKAATEKKYKSLKKTYKIIMGKI